MKNLPIGWTSTSLLNIVNLHDSQRIPLNQKQRAERPGNYPYYGANGQVDSINGFIFDGDYILLAEDGGYFDDPFRSVAYEVSGRFWVNNHAHIMSPCSEVPRRFLTYICNALDWMPYVGGSTRLKLTQESMRRILIPLPPLNEQKRIVAKLDRLFAHSRRAREELVRIPQLIDRYKKSILAAACSGRLTSGWRNSNQTLQSWKKVKLNDIGYLGRGKSKHRPRNDPKLYGGIYPFIQTGDIAQSDGMIKEHFQTYSDFGISQSKLWNEGTVCITIAANIANTAILTYPACFPDSVVGFIGDKDKCLPQFIKWSIDLIRDDLELLAPATAQKNINMGILNEVRFHLPPMEEQKEIVRRVEKLFKAIDTIAAEYQQAIKRLDRLDQAILAKAFRGELVPQDPTDEPAAALLARIQAEKLTQPKPTKAKRKPKINPDQNALSL